MTDDEGFWLYDLKIEVVLDDRLPVCRHVEGEYFQVQGENLIFKSEQKVSMYALAALLPLGHSFVIKTSLFVLLV